MGEGRPFVFTKLEAVSNRKYDVESVEEVVG